MSAFDPLKGISQDQLMMALGLDPTKPAEPKPEFVITEKNRLTVLQCRQILGSKADGMSDEQIAHLRDGLEKVAALLFDKVVGEYPNTVHEHLWLQTATEEQLEDYNREYEWEHFYE